MQFNFMRLRELRKNLALSQDELADELGLKSTQTIQNIENGKTKMPAPKTKQALANFFFGGEMEQFNEYFLVKVDEDAASQVANKNQTFINEQAISVEPDTDEWDFSVERSVLEDAAMRNIISRVSYNTLRGMLDKASKNTIGTALSRLLIIKYPTSSIGYPVDEFVYMLGMANLYPENAAIKQCWSNLVTCVDSLVTTPGLSTYLTFRGQEILQLLDRARTQDADTKLSALLNCGCWLQDTESVLDRYIDYRQALGLILALVEDAIDTPADRRHAFWACLSCAKALNSALKGGE